MKEFLSNQQLASGQREQRWRQRWSGSLWDTTGLTTMAQHPPLLPDQSELWSYEEDEVDTNGSTLPRYAGLPLNSCTAGWGWVETAPPLLDTTQGQGRYTRGLSARPYQPGIGLFSHRGECGLFSDKKEHLICPLPRPPHFVTECNY